MQRGCVEKLSLDIKKIYTDNPYVDEMVYYTKLLGLNTILKDKQKADDSETVTSMKESSIYMDCVQGSVVFGLFSYASKDILRRAGLPQVLIDACEKDITLVPEDKKATVTKLLSQQVIDTYVEKNDYYRMLYGLPPIGYTEVYIEDWIPPTGSVIDVSIPIHEMDNVSIKYLDREGVLDDMYEKDPEHRLYLTHLMRKVSPAIARKASRFGILYIPKSDSGDIERMYREKLENNREYVLRTVYSDAFKQGSDYYDNFIAIFIIITTMTDIITRVQEFVARKEIFDIRSIQYIFKSYGVPFFAEIPLKFQIAMVKNIHTLIKYKSSPKCMIDICSLFGFKNIKIFKYYLLRVHNMGPDGNYVFANITDDEGNEIEDYDTEYQLRFVKLPLEDNINDYIRVGSSHLDYDEISEADSKWDGGLDHNQVKLEILKQEFNYSRSKYISIDTVYDIAKISMQQCYFFNMLYDNVDRESMVGLQIPYIITGHSFNIADVFITLNVLAYYYKGIKDIIIFDQEAALAVTGFNFRADLNELANFLIANPYPSAVEAFNKFIAPAGSIPSLGEMMKIFVNNLEVRQALIDGMVNADNKRIFDIFKTLYDTLMNVELTFDFFKINNGDFFYDAEGDPTFSEFIRHRDEYLYDVIITAQSFEDQESRIAYISNVIDSIVYALEEFIDTEEFSGLFSNLPVVSSEAVKKYIATVINFYKSFKVDFLGMNTVYYLDDKLENTIKLIDSVDLKRYFEKNEIIKLYDFIKMHINITRDDRINLIERIYLDIHTWVYKSYVDHIILRDCIPTIISNLVLTSIVEITEEMYSRLSHLTAMDRVRLTDFMTNLIRLEPKDTVKINEEVQIVPYYEEKEELPPMIPIWPVSLNI